MCGLFQARHALDKLADDLSSGLSHHDLGSDLSHHDLSSLDIGHILEKMHKSSKDKSKKTESVVVAPPKQHCTVRSF
jgi:hypothetical protein